MKKRAEISLAAFTLTPTDTCRSLRDSAKEHLHAVLQMADLSNPAVRALPLLLLARLAHSEGDSPQAIRHLDEGLAMKGSSTVCGNTRTGRGSDEGDTATAEVCGYSRNAG
jgi:hypothetical protein